jgi:hypothetical protein
MKSSAVIFASIFGLVSASPSSFDKRSQPQGLDVSGWQGDVNWSQVKANGASFAMIKVSSVPRSYFITITNSFSGNRKH